MRKHAGTYTAICCYLLAMLFAYLLSGCTSTKDVTKQTTSVDSTYTKELEEMNRVLTSEVARLSAEVYEMQYGVVRFDTVFIPGDTVVNTITITKDGEVKAAGRIVSAMLTKSVLTKIVNEKNRVIDSLTSLKQKETVRYVTKTEYKDKHVKVTVFPWYFWLIAAAFGFLWFRKQFLVK